MRPTRLLLIDPPFYRLYKHTYGLCKAPLGLASLAAYVSRETDCQVRALNADFAADPEPFNAPYLSGPGYRAYRQALERGDHPAFAHVDRVAAEFAPDLVGLSVRTPALGSALVVARRIKRLLPNVVVLAGGPHPSVTGAAILAHEEFDAAVIGEGEATLAQVAREFRPGRPLAPVPGLICRLGGAVVRGPARAPLSDLDALPFPASLAPSVLVDGADYPARAFGYVFASRGCPRRCAYCSTHGVWGTAVRHRSGRGVARELSLLAARGVGHVHFDDDTFGGSPARLRALCRDIEAARAGLTLGCETHVSLVDEPGVEALVRAGFTTVQLGLESGDDAMLARVGKGFTVDRAERAAALVKAAGLRLEAFFMVGFPDETEASLGATRALMERLPCDKLIYSVFTPYPGTALYETCRARGLIGPDYDPSRHNHQSPENAFCPNIAPDRFRELAGEIEALAAERNAASRLAQARAGSAP